jgi:hypothetical protein
LLETINVGKSREAVFRLMGELTSASGCEIALLRTAKGRVLRLGIPWHVSRKGALRGIAHTHTNGKLGVSPDDYLIFLPSRVGGLGQRSTINIGPSGLWRRFTSNGMVLGGNF